jgi:hypothetical protein
VRISSRPLEALLAKLRANFNNNLATVATATYGVQPFQIEFPPTAFSKSTKSFFFGQISPDEIDNIGASNISKMTMFVQSSVNKNYEKPNDFSGDVQVGLDFHLQWLSSDTKQNLESLSLAVEDAFAETIQLLELQDWGSGVIYNGAFSCIRGSIVVPDTGQGGLRQTVAFRLGFQIDI